MNRKRVIQMPSRVDLKFSVSGMRPRELVLVCAAAVQAIWWVFMNPQWPFVPRLLIAAGIALVLLGIALVPINDLPIETHLVKFIRFRLRPLRRVSMNARLRKQGFGAANEQVEQVEEEAPVASPPIAVPRVRPSYGALTWLAPDPALVMAAFVCVLILGSIIAYVGRGGRF